MTAAVPIVRPDGHVCWCKDPSHDQEATESVRQAPSESDRTNERSDDGQALS